NSACMHGTLDRPVTDQLWAAGIRPAIETPLRMTNASQVVARAHAERRKRRGSFQRNGWAWNVLCCGFASIGGASPFTRSTGANHDSDKFTPARGGHDGVGGWDRYPR